METTIYKGYIIEPLRGKPYFSPGSQKENPDDRVHKFRVKVMDNGNVPDYGSFSVSGIPCRIVKNQFVAPDVSSNDTSWYYKTSKPIRAIGQVFVCEDLWSTNWVDASSTAETLWQRYEEDIKRNSIYMLYYEKSFSNHGITQQEFHKVLQKFGLDKLSATEFFTWLKFLCENDFDKSFCRGALHTPTPIDFQQKFHYTTRRYGVAKKAVQYYIDKTK